MSTTPTEPAPPVTDPVKTTATGAGGGYLMVSSYQTVQVLSSTNVVDVLYCTIQTHPSNVVASTPVQLTFFDQGNAAGQLTDFASGIEQVMTDPRVTAGTGDQSIDAAGTLVDNVAFTVEYTDPVRAPYGVTALAYVPVGLLYAAGGKTVPGLHDQVVAIIDSVYANLKATAGG